MSVERPIECREWEKPKCQRVDIVFYGLIQKEWARIQTFSYQINSGDPQAAEAYS